MLQQDDLITQKIELILEMNGKKLLTEVSKLKDEISGLREEVAGLKKIQEESTPDEMARARAHSG